MPGHDFQAQQCTGVYEPETAEHIACDIQDIKFKKNLQNKFHIFLFLNKKIMSVLETTQPHPT